MAAALSKDSTSVIKSNEGKKSRNIALGGLYSFFSVAIEFRDTCTLFKLIDFLILIFFEFSSPKALVIICSQLDLLFMQTLSSQLFFIDCSKAKKRSLREPHAEGYPNAQ
ncbi:MULTISPECIES: hypothetical protein [Enterobacterales]|jgi:hypothetical protein|uniref:hypothetical protein n=1 Tax=Enterobacterales TaxID=91347 RepID=UPI0012AB7737|nr:hypothetical protein [Klebsiella grimontii]MBZ7137957.1 hypothetical protein [Klebsiella grimontii]